MKTGLTVTTRTITERNILQNWINQSAFHAEYNNIEDYFFFPEEEENYDALEETLTEEFNKLDVNVEFEGMF